MDQNLRVLMDPNNVDAYDLNISYEAGMPAVNFANQVVIATSIRKHLVTYETTLPVRVIKNLDSFTELERAAGIAVHGRLITAVLKPTMIWM